MDRAFVGDEQGLIRVMGLTVVVIGWLYLFGGRTTSCPRFGGRPINIRSGGARASGDCRRVPSFAAGVCVSRRGPCHRCMGDFRPSDVIAAHRRDPYPSATCGLAGAEDGQPSLLVRHRSSAERRWVPIGSRPRTRVRVARTMPTRTERRSAVWKTATMCSKLLIVAESILQPKGLHEQTAQSRRCRELKHRWPFVSFAPSTCI
jgi:hypothetical protein